MIRVLSGPMLPGFFEGRIYVKQQPHVRIVLHAGDDLVGQVALDRR